MPLLHSRMTVVVQGMEPPSEMNRDRGWRHGESWDAREDDENGRNFPPSAASRSDHDELPGNAGCGPDYTRASGGGESERSLENRFSIPTARRPFAPARFRMKNPSRPIKTRGVRQGGP